MMGRLINPLFVPLLLIVACLTAGCKAGDDTAPLEYSLVSTLPHDPASFIQGAEIVGDLLYESAGRYGESRVMVTDLHSGQLLRQHSLDRKLFAEGLTLVDDTLFLLTWKAGKAFAFDRHSLEPKAEYALGGEGWGLAYDGQSLLKTDGSAWLSFLSPHDLQVQRSVQVKVKGRPLSALNELEYVDGWLLANVWKQDRVVLICPGSGEVAAWLDLSTIAAKHRNQGVLNGLAYWHNRQALLISGKNWDQAYLLRFTFPDPARSC